VVQKFQKFIVAEARTKGLSAERLGDAAIAKQLGLTKHRPARTLGSPQSTKLDGGRA
jgi:hypothetical protein